MAHQYVKGALIGKGTFGEVFRGTEISTSREVALKLVDLEQADEEIDVGSQLNCFLKFNSLQFRTYLLFPQSFSLVSALSQPRCREATVFMLN